MILRHSSSMASCLSSLLTSKRSSAGCILRASAIRMIAPKDRFCSPFSYASIELFEMPEILTNTALDIDISPRFLLIFLPIVVSISERRLIEFLISEEIRAFEETGDVENSIAIHKKILNKIRENPSVNLTKSERSIIEYIARNEINIASVDDDTRIYERVLAKVK